MTYRYLTGRVLPLPADSRLPAYHLPGCYGCGPDNEHGLGLRFRLEADKVVSELDFAPWFEGGPGVVHGGATAAFFDDLMGSVLMAHLRPSVTARLEMNYLRPVPLGVRIRGEAWLAEDAATKLWVEAAGTDDAGVVYVEARALFVPIRLDHWARAVERLTPDQQAQVAQYRKDGYYP